MIRSGGEGLYEHIYCLAGDTMEYSWDLEDIEDIQEASASPQQQSYVEPENLIDQYNYIQQIKRLEQDWEAEQIRLFCDLREQASSKSREPTPMKKSTYRYSIHPNYYHE